MDSVENKRILDALIEAEVDFVVIGGVAIVLHGVDYHTVDIDFAIEHSSETAQRIADAMAPYHPRPLGFPPDLPYVWDKTMVLNTSNLVMESDIGRFDLLSEPAGIDSYTNLRSRAIEFPLFGHMIKVASIDDLIEMKRAAGRDKDLEHIRHLEAVKKILEE